MRIIKIVLIRLKINLDDSQHDQVSKNQQKVKEFSNFKKMLWKLTRTTCHAHYTLCFIIQLGLL